MESNNSANSTPTAGHTERAAILPKVIDAAPKWALRPTVDDMFGPVAGQIEVQYDGQNLAGEHEGWTTEAHLSQMVVFSLAGDVLEAMPVTPTVTIDSSRIDPSVDAHAANVEALMRGGAALIRLAAELDAARAL